MTTFKPGDRVLHKITDEVGTVADATIPENKMVGHETDNTVPVIFDGDEAVWFTIASRLEIDARISVPSRLELVTEASADRRRDRRQTIARRRRHAKKFKSDLDETISRLIETYGLSLLLAEVAVHDKSGSLGAAIDRVFEKFDIDWSELGARAHFAEPPLPEDYWARDLVAGHGMPAVLKALARHKERDWREAFRELSRACDQP